MGSSMLNEEGPTPRRLLYSVFPTRVCQKSSNSGCAAPRLPSTSGGGIAEGRSQDYEIELKPVQCVYSCLLNPPPITNVS